MKGNLMIIVKYEKMYDLLEVTAIIILDSLIERSMFTFVEGLLSLFYRTS